MQDRPSPTGQPDRLDAQALRAALLDPASAGPVSLEVAWSVDSTNAELLRRKKEAVLAKGEVWIDPEEQERLDLERAAQEREANRVQDLKDRCARRGLDFETENRKYLEKQAIKQSKQEKKKK